MNSSTDSSPADPAGELLRERDRVVQRLRSMALDAIPVERVRSAGQDLADLAADARDGHRRTVPVLAAHASGDLIAVLTTDLLRTAGPVAVDAAEGVLRALRHDLAGDG